MRMILVTGKGGVGKTTLSAATALQAASLGHRVLLTSTDRAHSLGDVLLEERLGYTPVEVAPGCWAQELSASAIASTSWSEIGRYFQELLQWVGVDAADAEELAVVPGIEELLALADLHTTSSAGDYDTVVVDCAPSAETLRLLEVPHLLRSFAGRVGMDRRAGQVLSRVVGHGFKLPTPSREALAAIDELERCVIELSEVLASPAKTVARVVTTPERLVVKEALRTYTYLSLFGVSVDALLVNQVVPNGEPSELLGAMRRRQAEQLAEVDRAFGDLPRLESPMLSDEPLGSNRLTQLGELVYGCDPTQRLSDVEPVSVRALGDQRVLTIPAADHSLDEVTVDRCGDDLRVTLGDRCRPLALPDSLRDKTVVGGGLRDGYLEIVFEAVR